MRLVFLAGILTLAATACTRTSEPAPTGGDAAQREGIALEGSIDHGFDLHLYRFAVGHEDAGAVVQLHPSANSVTVTVVAVDHADEALLACPVQVGDTGHDRLDAACTELSMGSAARVDLLYANGRFHVGFIITSAGPSRMIHEALVSWTPADNWLAIDFTT